MPLITQIEWWTKALQENFHLKIQPGENINTHRKIEDYDKDDIKNRISAINGLIKGNEVQMFEYIAKRIKQSMTVSKNALMKEEQARLSFIARVYFFLEQPEEIQKIDDDIFYALLVYIDANQTKVIPHLNILQPLCRCRNESHRLACIRWGMVTYLYDLLVAAEKLSRESQFRRVLGIFPISAGPPASVGITVGAYHAVRGLSEKMPTWAAILCIAGTPTIISLINFIRQKLRYFRSSFWRRVGYTDLEADTESLQDNLDSRPLTKNERIAFGKNINWQITLITSIWLAAAKIAIETYSNKTVDEFFSEYTVGIIPAGSLDYVYIMIQQWIIARIFDYFNIRRP